jgi:cell division protein FtsN
MPEAKTPLEIVSVPPVAVRPEPLQAPFETNLPIPAQSVARNPPPAIEPTIQPEPLTPALAIEKTAATPGAGQLALLSNKPIEATPAKPAIARAAPKPLEGFIIQLAFNDRERAQRWAEGMEKKGFAVSLTEAGAEGALRVRLGIFVLRDDAERQLISIKQEGLSGIILNLPQAFRPEAPTSIP